jgi:hypothetical protein
MPTIHHSGMLYLQNLPQIVFCLKMYFASKCILPQNVFCLKMYFASKCILPQNVFGLNMYFVSKVELLLYVLSEKRDL